MDVWGVGMMKRNGDRGGWYVFNSDLETSWAHVRPSSSNRGERDCGVCGWEVVVRVGGHTGDDQRERESETARQRDREKEFLCGRERANS